MRSSAECLFCMSTMPECLINSTTCTLFHLYISVNDLGKGSSPRTWNDTVTSIEKEMSADTELDMLNASLCYTSALSLLEGRGGTDLLPSSNRHHPVDFTRDSRRRRSPSTESEDGGSRDTNGAHSVNPFHAGPNSIEKGATEEEAFDLSAPLRHALFTAALVVPRLKKTMRSPPRPRDIAAAGRPEFSLPVAVPTPNRKAGRGTATPRTGFEDKNVMPRRTLLFDREPENATGNGRTENRFRNLPTTMTPSTDDDQAGKGTERRRSRRTGEPDEDKNSAGRAEESTGKKGVAANDPTPENEMELIGNLINNNASAGDVQLAYIDD